MTLFGIAHSHAPALSEVGNKLAFRIHDSMRAEFSPAGPEGLVSKAMWGKPEAFIVPEPNFVVERVPREYAVHPRWDFRKPSGKSNHEPPSESSSRQLACALCGAWPNTEGIQPGASGGHCRERPSRGAFSSRTRVREGQPKAACRLARISHQFFRFGP